MQGSAPRGGEGRLDLHTHTCFSDGLLTPEALIDLAVSRGLAAIAITDHDTLDGIAAGAAAAEGRITFVPGIELSTVNDGVELHLLGYHVDSADERFRSELTGFRAQRLGRISRMVERLNEMGAQVSTEDVLAQAGPGVVGRPHLAAALVRGGYAESMDDAFRRFIGRSGSAFIPRPAPTTEDAIALVRRCGGVPVLAHPGSSVSDATVERLAEAGLGGVEVWHPHHAAPAVRRYRMLASRLGLIETGGSDFHGPGRSAELGTSRVPARVLKDLARAAGR